MKSYEIKIENYNWDGYGSSSEFFFPTKYKSHINEIDLKYLIDRGIYPSISNTTHCIREFDITKSGYGNRMSVFGIENELNWYDITVRILKITKRVDIENFKDITNIINE